MTTLLEFLSVRIAVDEARALGDRSEVATIIDLPLGTTRQLREVAAKQAILAEHSPEPYPYDDGEPLSCTGCGLGSDEEYRRTIPECATLLALAAIYADHDDYREEWDR